MTRGRVIPIEGHVRRGVARRPPRPATPPPAARRGRAPRRSRSRRGASAGWRWLIAIGAAVLLAAMLLGRISRPLRPPRMLGRFDDGATIAGFRANDDDRPSANETRAIEFGAIGERRWDVGRPRNAGAADGIVAALERRPLPSRLPR